MLTLSRMKLAGALLLFLALVELCLFAAKLVGLLVRVKVFMLMGERVPGDCPGVPDPRVRFDLRLEP